MEVKSIVEEFLINGRKVVLGVRCSPGLKNELSIEASALGLSLSEYCENILLNNEALLRDRVEAKKEAVDLKLEVSKLNNLLAATRIKSKEEMDTLRRENDKLKEKLSLAEGQVALFSDKRLLDLFAQVKGQRDLIETPGNSVPITYNSTKDLLTAMIYSFQLKKP